MRNFRKYDVWVKAHALTLFVYKDVITSFPKVEQYALVSQIKRAVYSIPLNIVEGCGRNTDKDFVHFLDMALGSVNEVEYCGVLALDLSYIDNEKYDGLMNSLNEVKAKLINLIKTIRKIQ
jgi:four helix bundle protein